MFRTAVADSCAASLPPRIQFAWAVGRPSAQYAGARNGIKGLCRVQPQGHEQLRSWTSPFSRATP